MNKHNDATKSLHDKAVEELIQKVDPEKAENLVSHWFGSATQNDGGADKDDVKYYLAIVKFLKRLRSK